jgi:hypothetical protein
MHTFSTAPLVAVAASLALAAPAVAATEVGQTGVQPYSCSAGYEYGDAGYQVPAGGGTITRLSFAQTALNAGQHVDLNVLAPNPDGSYTVIGGTGPQTLDGTPGVRSFPVDLPVQGGEILGLFTDSRLLNNCLRSTADMLPITYVGDDPAPGTSFYIDEVDGGFSLNASATLQTAPALTAAGLGTTADPVLAPAAFSGPVGSAGGAGLSATIDWGDASSSAGTVGTDGTVSGSHAYGATGPYTVTLHVTDAAGDTADAVSHLLVYGTAGAGSFVVGDRSATGTVTFASSQWAKRNALSGGDAPSAFKGYADAGLPQCGAAFGARPGNGMPGAVPAYLAVTVTDAVAKVGSEINGTVRRVVVVRADPRAPGTGTVVATVCG